MAEDIKNIEGKEKEDWMQQKWRPAMGWMYMVVCMCDFMVFPVLWSIHQALNHGQVASQWQPLTLQGAGLFHLAMGAVLGIAAYGRTQEKMAGAAGGNGAAQTPGFGAPQTPPSFGATTAPSFGSTPLGNNSASTAPSFAAPTFGSKPSGPGRAEQPEL
jgi:hypothetical protein